MAAGYATNNAFSLQRTDATNPTGRIDFLGSGGTGGTRWSVLTDADVGNDFGVAYNGAKVFQILTSGNVGIRTTLPGTNLSIKQSSNTQYVGGIELIRGDAANNAAVLVGGDNAFYAFAGGTFANFAPGATAWTFGSDRRLKENIQYIESSGLDVINQLKPATFNFIGSEKQEAGFIAQDVLPVLPISISTAITGYYGMNQTMVIPYLVKATQELASTTAAIQTKLDELEVENGALKARIEALVK